MEIHEVPLRIRVRLSRLKFGSWYLPKKENQIQKENIWERKRRSNKKLNNVGHQVREYKTDHSDGNQELSSFL